MTEPTNSDRTKKLRLVSKVILLVTVAFWAIYDILPSMNAGRGDTLSEVTRDWSRAAPTIPFFWGALTGHFFLNFGQQANYQALFYTLAALFVVLITANVISYFAFDMTEFGPQVRAAALFTGVGIGTLLWGQNP